MPALTSPVALINLALDRLAHENISSITPATTRVASLCARHYDYVRRRVLRSFVWNFAKQQILLTAAGDITIPFGYSVAFHLPIDCLRILRVGNYLEGAGYRPGDYAVIGEAVYLADTAADATLPLEYIADTTDAQLFDPTFSELLVLELAKALAYPLSVRPDDPNRLNADIREAALRAAAICGQENPPMRIEQSRLITARRNLSRRHIYEGTLDFGG